MTQEELRSRVVNCIARKQKGDSWDFKWEWHDVNTTISTDYGRQKFKNSKWVYGK